MTPEERAQHLETLVGDLLARVDRIDQELLYRRPAPADWSVMEVLAHVAEILPYWSLQAQEVAGRSVDNQPFGRTHDDPDRIAAVERHAGDPLEVVLPRIRSGLAESASILRSIPADRWSRTARHARRGEMSIEQLVDFFLLDHLREHIEQIGNGEP